MSQFTQKESYDVTFMDDLMFSSIIRAVEAEIDWEYMPEAIGWVDKNFNNAWSIAIDRFDRALSTLSLNKDIKQAKREAEVYKQTVLDLLSKYKKHKQFDETKNFIQSLQLQGELRRAE